MKATKRNYNKFKKTKKRKSKSKMHGGNLISIDKILSELPTAGDFSDIKCGTFVKKEDAFIPSYYPPGTVKGVYTPSYETFSKKKDSASKKDSESMENYFFYVKNFKYKNAEFEEDHVYTGYASLNPKAKDNPNGLSARLQRYFKQIQGINYYPNGDICSGCFLYNSPDGHAKYYKYMGEKNGKKQYKLEYDGQWKYGRYHAEPQTLRVGSKILQKTQ
jgi:hypothetical protein